MPEPTPSNIPPSDPSKHAPSSRKKQPPPLFSQENRSKKQVVDSGKKHQFGPLVFSDKQWKKFMRQLAQTISQEIRRQEKRIKKAQERLKRSVKGEPL